MRFWNFRNDLDQDGQVTTLDIEGELVVDDGWWIPNGAVCARDFRDRLRQCGDVIVRINSPGGDVLAGSELYAALREHAEAGYDVTVHITALAASAASVVAMAGNKVLMSPAAYMMIHNPWSICAGNADDLRQLADQLDAVAEGIIEAYRLKTGRTRSELKEMLDAETYMSAPTAIKKGFADGLLYQPKESDAQPQETSMAAAQVGARMVARMKDKNGLTPEESLQDRHHVEPQSGSFGQSPQDDRDSAALAALAIADAAEAMI